MDFSLTKKQLLFELYIAEADARKHKSRKPYVVEFEKSSHDNLLKLCDELYYRTYRPSRSICFIVKDPKKREVFAAVFRDRIVHHLYFNLTHKLFEQTFIYDTYSCIKGRGTHFGIERLSGHIRKESLNYSRDCYILKMDIKGYFMHIDRNILLQIIKTTLEKLRYKKPKNSGPKIWNEIIDFDFINYLSEELVMVDPTMDCIFRSDISEWDDLPKSKSLFKSPKGFGLPIGNLTSQLFSNIFLNLLDQFCKRELKCKHYGRYVDDFYIVSHNLSYLRSIIPKIERFLKEELHLDINKGKTKISNYKNGVEFLGTFIKPYREYVSNECLGRMKKKIFENENIAWKNGKNIECSVNSYMGVFIHNASYNIRKELFLKTTKLNNIGIFNESYTKYYKTINFIDQTTPR